MTATGNDTGRQAVGSFTDAAINVSTTQGETATAGVPTGTYVSGDIKSYRELDKINFRFTLTNSDAAARSGNVTIEYDDVGAGCSPAGFFQQPFNLGTWNSTHPPVESTAGSVPSVVPVGSPFVNGSDLEPRTAFRLQQQRDREDLLLPAAFGRRGSVQRIQHSRRIPSSSQTGDVGSPGTQSWPVPAKDVIQLGDVTVIKRIDRDGNGTFESLANPGEYQFCMPDYPTAPTCRSTDANGQVVFTNVPDGSHAITEQQLDFSQGTYAFVSGSGTGVNGGTCTFSGSTATATVVGDTTNPDSATCTFNNGLVKGRSSCVSTGSAPPAPRRCRSTMARPTLTPRS